MDCLRVLAFLGLAWFPGWWDTINWGTAPDWLAAIGTVGALGVTIAIVFTDRRDRRRAEADRVIVTTVVQYPRGSGELRIVLHNANNHPVPYPTIYYWSQGEWQLRNLIPPSSYEVIAEKLTMDPDESIETALGYSDHVDSPADDYYVEIIDSQGRTRHRNVLSNEYLSSRRLRRWRRRGNYRWYSRPIAALRRRVHELTRP